METNFLKIPTPKPSLLTIPTYRKTPSTISTTTTIQHSQVLSNCTKTTWRLNSTTDNNLPQPEPSQPPRPTVTPPNTVEIRFRRGSKRRSRQREEGITGNQVQAKADPPKKWEDMSMAEKAMDVYMGEKGLLFWLNKFAYASIFIVIGGWILFRFVGPALNLYQLDSTPLSPSSMFKGS